MTLLLTVAAAGLVAQPARASVSDDDVHRFQAQVARGLSHIDQTARVSTARINCRQALAHNDELQAPVWCIAAWTLAKPLPPADAVRTQAATDAVVATGEVYRLGPADFIPLRGPTPSSPELATALAAATINASRSRAQLPGDVYRSLAGALGIVKLPAGDAGQQRLELLGDLSGRTSQVAAIWAAAAVTGTAGYGDILTPQDRRALAEAAAPFLDASRRLTGRDAVLFPLMALEVSELEAQQLETSGRATSLRQEGETRCRQALWPDHPLCIELRYRAAYWTAYDQSPSGRAKRSQTSGAPLVGPKLVQGKAAADLKDPKFAGSCKAVLSYDVDDSGAPVRVRVLYSEPGGKCADQAAAALAKMRYSSRAAGQPDELRSGLLEGYDRTVAW